MQIKRSIRVAALLVFGLSLVLSMAFAVVIHDTKRYERPIRTIRGTVTGLGEVQRTVSVDVYDNAQVWLDQSLPMVEKRKRQTMVATVHPDAKGQFNIKHLQKGFYEVEFGNHNGGGLNELSVLVNVDPKGTNDRLCVDLSLEGGSGESSLARCSAK